MAISVNFTGVQDSGFELIEKGEYTAAVFDITMKEGKAAPYLNWTFKILDGKYDGRRLFDITSLAPQALFRLKAHLKAIMPEVDLSGALSFDPADLVGKKCIIVIGHETYNGELRERILKVKPVGGVGAGVPANAKTGPSDQDLPFL